MRRMLSRVCAAAIVLCAAALPVGARSLFNPRTMIRTAELRPGMRGMAKTVFRGTEITEFNVEVVGVLKKANLGGDMVLIRVLDGPVVARGCGVARGMSGSPVYVDGRLLGAIAFTYRFAKEPFGGVTPVEDMLEALEHPDTTSYPRSAEAPVIPAQIGGRTITKAAVAGFGADLENLAQDHETIVMEPLGVMLSCSGFSRRALEVIADALEPFGIHPVAGPGPLPESDWVDVDLQPGAAIGVALMSGDFTGAVTGTLTYRDENVLLAFGHPFMQSGRVDMPLVTAWVHDVIPSTDISNKLTSIMKTVGVIQQDRAWSVAGVLGGKADTVSVNIEIRDRTRDLTKKYHVDVVQHEDMTVPMVLSGLFNAVDATYKPSGRGTARVRMKVRTTSGREISHENVFYSTASVGDTTVQEAVQSLTFLTKNSFDRQKIASVEVVSELTEEERSATIEDVYAEQTIARAGEELVLHVRLKHKQEPEFEKVVTLKIPEEVQRGAMRIGVTGGGGQRSLESRLGIVQPEARSLDDLIERFETTERNDRLVVIAALPNPSFRVNNRQMSRVPSAIASTLAQSRWTDLRQGREKMVKVVETDYVLTGQQTLSIATQDKEGKKGKAPPGRPPSPPKPAPRRPNAKAPNGSFALVGQVVRGRARALMMHEDDVAEAEPTSVQVGRSNRSNSAPAPRAKQPGKGAQEEKEAEKKEKEKPAAPVMRQSSEWLQTKGEDFEKGEAKGVALVSTGEIVLAPEIERLSETQEFYLWSAVADAKGNAYFGSGPNGIIYKVTPQGDLSTFYDSDELAVHALALLPDGSLIAGTAPEGRILKISPSGEGTVLHDADCQAVWSLAVKGNDVYAGCGPDGRILKIAPDGSVAEFARLPATSVLSLAFAGDALYAGTSDDGVVYRIQPDGTHVAVFGAAEKSVCALAVGANGNVYAGTDPGALVVRISPDGEFETVYDSDERAVFALLADGEDLYAATGDGGRVLRIRDNPGGESAVADLGETKRPQALCMAKVGGDTLLVGTGNMGAIVKVALSPRGSGHFESEVLDAKVAARWGVISWVADVPEGAEVYLQTRSGNTPDPDDEWSPWSHAYVDPSGEPIASPPGRYLQYKATIVGSRRNSPIVKSVKVVYLPANRKPKLDVQAPQEGAALSGKAELKWKAEDADKDKLLFAIYTSRDARKTWEPLKEDLEEPKYEWDTTTVEDGRYAVRITASDELANPGAAQLAEEVADPVIVDNTPPRIVEKD
ncbi:MAG: SpoIVB peptidase S55 domain-containing protein, partial [Armatimonadota bacterium]